ncbi:multidrug resistance transporter [Spathaspora passalidarum NRRL Y-27907]|uniref:Multidrug resistance transporter n=1 Tax=Spathaspora passalidarum (strain NRRL Y-27907 / 11-Y1) TaxID=619300 RepID=G3AHT5_SPAPN|nr:multidrug resistance transporter [Spathaspora passalidarum NRRL Y-27907]EGW34249.1 multidrug resistance transporter [Spathaspora passalidarum NRRL Y-27907]
MSDETNISQDKENQIGLVTTSTSQPPPPYTILTKKEKYAIAVLISASSIWSTLSSSIYFPALTILSHDFDVSPGIINISIVAYFIFQGISPTLLATVADTYGRRPCVLLCLVCYTGVCIGLSQSNVYWLLAFLRCLQAAAISPIIAVTAGILSDITTRADRGSYIGTVSGIQLIGQGFGALVGAGVVSRWGWQGVFVLLAIGSGFMFICCVVFLPETNRSIVGNMSVPPKYIYNQSPVVHFPCCSHRLTNDVSTLSPRTSANIFAPYKIFFKPAVFFTLLAGGFQFTAWTMNLTTLSTSMQVDYGFSVVHVGLCYLAPGMGTLVGSVGTGRLLDYTYRRRKTAYDSTYGHLPKEQQPPFDLFGARFQTAIFTSVIIVVFLIVFGWCIEKHTNIAPILISSFMISLAAVSFMGCMNTLLVDLFPNQGSAATSCLNLMRCLLGAAGVGALSAMIDAMGTGGTYTLMSGFCIISFLILSYLSQRAKKKREAKVNLNSMDEKSS